MSSRVADRVTAIDAGVSSYLDLMRAFAAMVVIFSHLLPILFGYYAIPGNDAVIVFFVISGYVIAYAYENREFKAELFITNRLARLWSVLLPSLAISAVAFLMEAGSDIMFAQSTPSVRSFVVSAVQNALFLGQNWGWSTSAPYNDPTWSLNYEAWYYAIFAAFVFTPKRWRWYAAAVAVLLAGPAIVALMPCWLLGTFLYYRRNSLRLPSVVAVGLFVVCILSYGATYWFDLNTHGRAWLKVITLGRSYWLRSSTGMIGDSVNACLFGGTIIAVQNMAVVNRVLARLRGFAKTISSRTFSCYLYHMPIFVILYGGLGFGEASGVQSAVCIAAVIWLCVAFGRVTEARLSSWRAALQKVARAGASS